MIIFSFICFLFYIWGYNTNRNNFKKVNEEYIKLKKCITDCNDQYQILDKNISEYFKYKK